MFETIVWEKHWEKRYTESMIFYCMFQNIVFTIQLII